MNKNLELNGRNCPGIKSMFLILFTFFATAIFAQVNVRGVVQDATGETLIGVNLTRIIHH